MRVVKPPYGRQKAVRKPKKWPVMLVATVFIAAIVLYAVLAVAKPTSAIQPTTVELPAFQAAAPSINWPGSGQAAIGSLAEGLLAESSEIQQKKPIASMTKIITVLAVLDKNPLGVGEQGKTYIVTQADVQLFGSYLAKNGSVVPVTAGQEITEYQAIQAILLPSANNMADSLAVWTFGSIEDYLVYANSLVKNYGLSETTISDASGFSPLTNSTPSDMIAIGQKALQNSVIREVVATKSAVIPGSGEVKNSNQLLNDPGVIGIKTGNTDEAGHCLLFAVTHGPDSSHVLIGVVMGQANWPAAYSAARSLRDSSLDDFGSINLISESTKLADYETEWGESSSVVNTDQLNIYGWKGKSYSLKSELNDLQAPVSAGQVVGKVYLEQNTGISSNLVTTSTVNKPPIFWRLTNFL